MKKILRKIPKILMIISLFIMAYTLYNIVYSKYKVNKNLNKFNILKEATVKGEKETKDKPKSEVSNKKINDSAILGILKIYDSNIPVLKGASESTLKEGAGHLNSSSLPGENGNCVILGHRDSVFSILKNVKKDDEIYIETIKHTFFYKVVSTYITYPSDKSFMKNKDDSTLTLITCYPFNYIGSAPKRFIVIAKLQK
ncbi:class D sortase [Clostridium oceanicum]